VVALARSSPWREPVAALGPFRGYYGPAFRLTRPDPRETTPKLPGNRRQAGILGVLCRIRAAPEIWLPCQP